jgi:DNA ligase-1
MKESESQVLSSYFSSLVETCELVRDTSSKNKKVDILVKYISTLDESSLQIAVLFLSGRIFPRGSQLNLNIGFRTILQSLIEISNMNEIDITKIHLEHGDMGSMAEFAVSKKEMVTLFSFGEEVTHKLTLQHLKSQFKRIAGLNGPSSFRDKKNLLKGMLVSCSPLEAKYLVKIVTNEMRIGSYEGLVEAAIAKAFSKDIGLVREAILLSGDIANVALSAKRDELHLVTVKPFVPMSFMLADVMYSADEIVDYFGKSLLSEFKYDGIRVQVHRFGSICKLFSRNLSDITFAFPEIVRSILRIKRTGEKDNKKSKIDVRKKEYEKEFNFILDGELIAWKDGIPLPFQELQKRLRKKVLSEDILLDIPVQYIIYDIMFYEDSQVIKKELDIRRGLMTNLELQDKNIVLAKSSLIKSAKDIDNNFRSSRNEGHEGLVIKDPSSHYHPGKRGRYWIKLKEELDTIDAVVVIAEYGHGKRAGTLSDYTLAIKDTVNNSSDSVYSEIFDDKFHPQIPRNLKIIGKAYSGLSDEEIAYMTNRLKGLIVRDEGSRLIVKPEIVLEVTFDTIQKSNRHSGGYALRFPRIKNIRFDKGMADIDSMEKIQKIFDKQFHTKMRAY